MVVRHPDGRPRWTVETLDGRPHGRSEVYAKEGHLVSRGTFRDGRRDGVFEYLDASGKVIRREVFRADRLLWTGSDPVPVRLAAPPRLPTVAPPPTATADFAIADRPSRDDRAVVEVGILPTPGERFDSAARVEVFAQRTFAIASLYADATIATASAPDMMRGSGTGKLVLEVGAARARAVPGPFPRGSQYGLVRLGAFVPVSGDDRDGYFAGAALGYARLTDAIKDTPRAAGLRASGSLIGQEGFAQYRADLGVDLALGLPGQGDVSPPRRASALARANLAAGFVSRYLAGAIELSTVAALERSAAERLAHSLALSLRLRAISLRPFAGLVVPLDDTAGARAMAILVGLEYVELTR